MAGMNWGYWGREARALLAAVPRAGAAQPAAAPSLPLPPQPRLSWRKAAPGAGSEGGAGGQGNAPLSALQTPGWLQGPGGSSVPTHPGAACSLAITCPSSPGLQQTPKSRSKAFEPHELWLGAFLPQLPQHPSSCCPQSQPMHTPNSAGRAGACTSCSNPPRFPWRLNTESLPGRLETRGGGMWCLCGPGGNKGSLHSRAQPSPSWPGRAPSPPPSCCPLLFPASSPDKPSVLPKAPNRLAAARSSSPPSHYAQAED